MELEQLEQKARWVRRQIVEMAARARTGHVTSSLSEVEILVALYYGGILKFNPKDPKDPGRDRFVLSKSHGGLGLYPILADLGYFPLSELERFALDGSSVCVHAEHHLPGIEFLGGSLGHGLTIATGMAQALKDSGSNSLVWVLTGDGELAEGSNWEALNYAQSARLDNLVVVVDGNRQSMLGRLEEDGPLACDGPIDFGGALALRLRTFGGSHHTRDAYGYVDGHNFESLVEAFEWTKAGDPEDPDGGGPRFLVCDTKKGRGVSIVEDARGWHSRPLLGAELEQARKELSE